MEYIQLELSRAHTPHAMAPVQRRFDRVKRSPISARAVVDILEVIGGFAMPPL